MQLKIPIGAVSFRKVWSADPKTAELRLQFSNLQNWPWRGLFWLSKDFIDAELRASAEPDAQELSLIRNCLEHRYLKIHEIEPPKARKGDLWHDRMAHSVQREEFNRKTLRLLKLSRAALIYLSLGMHREEQQREEKKGPDGGLAAPMHLDTWQDEWKQ
ncbi:MAG: LA2681 family HEPN domain-containing protein [Pseudolabrys sp.]